MINAWVQRAAKTTGLNIGPPIVASEFLLFNSQIASFVLFPADKNHGEPCFDDIGGRKDYGFHS
jgi:hypothetical protein